MQHDRGGPELAPADWLLSRLERVPYCRYHSAGTLTQPLPGATGQKRNLLPHCAPCPALPNSTDYVPLQTASDRTH